VGGVVGGVVMVVVVVVVVLVCSPESHFRGPGSEQTSICRRAFVGSPG
jgi:hypothetical protein